MQPLTSSGLISDSAVHDILLAAEGRAVSTSLSRRVFLKLTSLAGGGLVLAFHMSDAAAAATSEAFSPNAFVRIGGDGSILIYSKGPEIGQGIKTAFPLIVAEELDADWAHVQVDQAPINPAVYGRQSAGGSRSIPMSWDQLRRAGAVARAMLVSAAAKKWSVPESECTTDNSVVFHRSSGRSLSYGELADAAALLPVPDEKTVRLKARSEYKLLGKRFGGVDNDKIVSGQPLFGIDQVVPGMLYGVFHKCPRIGGRVRSANLEHIRTLPGVRQAFIVQGTGKATEVMPGVAILATSTWAAFKAKRELQVDWDEDSASRDDWAEASKQANELARRPGAQTLRSSGDITQAPEGKSVEAFYSYPFVAHAPLEPQNCTAWVRGDAVEIWAPTQTPEAGLKLVATLLNIPEDKVTLHQTRVGGGFGRRLMNDYMCEAALISKQAGAPVKLQWTREDDMTHDFYRVGGFHSLKGRVDTAGKVLAWQNHFITFSADGSKPVPGGDLSPEEFPALLVPNVHVTQTLLPLTTPCGPWRAPRSNAIAFAVQSFLHELSTAAGMDHVDFLLQLMGEPRWLEPKTEFALNTGRASAVIKLAAEKSGWGRRLPKGHVLGLAFHFSHAGHFAEVAEVSVDAKKKVTVHRVTVAGDVGPIVNMSGAETQCQGAVIDGLSTMARLEMRIENGQISPANFHEYPILRMGQEPRVDAYFIQSDFTPTGIGEPALPPLAPAVCNAIFTATGERVRSLPLTQHGFSI